MARLILGHTTDTSIKVWIRASERWPVAFVDVVDCDNNASYHATLEVSRGEKRIVINELMSSPINQYTPNVRPEQIYNMNHSHTLPNGVSTLSSIDPDSFYGNHSNVMVIDVDMTSARQTVGYKIFRTTKTGAGPSGKFHP